MKKILAGLGAVCLVPRHYFAGGLIGLFAWAVILLFVPLVIPAEHSSTVWEFDPIRAERSRLDEQRKSAEEFNRTNTNPAMSAVIEANYHYEWRPQKGQRELGYRNDGVVVWRLVPESNPSPQK